MAFVGYGYIRNATAQIIYPSGANTGIAASSPSPELEKELRVLKEAQVKTNGSISKLEATIQNLNSEKKRLEAEKEQLRVAKEQAISDNMDLETKVSSLKKLSSEATANSNLVQELNEIKFRLEKELEDANVELRSLREESMKLQLSIKDISKGKASVETKFKETVDGIQGIQMERDALAEKLKNSSITISQKSKELGEATSKTAKLLNELDSLNVDLKSKSDIVAEKQTRILEQNDQIRSLEKELALLKLDQIALQARVSSFKSENDSLSSDLTALKQSLSTPTNSHSEVEALESQLASLLQIKSKLSDDLMEVSKIKATIEVELAMSLKDKLDAEREKTFACESLQTAELKVAELTKSFAELQSDKLQVEMKLSSTTMELERAQKAIVVLESTVQDLEVLLDERENLYSTLSEESQATAGKLQLEKEHMLAMDDKMKKTEIDLASERKLRIAAEASLASEKLDITTRAKRVEIELQTLQTNFKILEIDFAAQKTAKEEATQKFLDVRAELQLVQRSKTEISEFYTITQNELNDAKSEIDRCHSKIDELTDKLNEYEKQNNAMKTKVEVMTLNSPPLARENTNGSVDVIQRKVSSGHTGRPTMEKVPSSKSTDKLFTRSRMSAMFFKSKDNLTEAMSPEKGGYPEDRHARNQTRQSQLSSTDVGFPAAKIPTNVTRKSLLFTFI